MNQIDLARAGRLRPELSTGPSAVMKATVLQLTVETSREASRRLLPPALHPVNPGVLVITAFEVAASAQRGSFRLVEVGLQCRAGARARRYVIGAAVDDPSVADELAVGWGYVSKPAAIRVDRRYERIDLIVDGESTTLRASLLRPEPVTPSAVLYLAGLRPTVYQDEPWIAQVERTFEISRADRGRPAVTDFDGGWWTDGEAPDLRATDPISGSFTRSDVTLNPMRFLIAPGTSRAADTRRLADVLV
ncbi:MAG: acetoacetate decarboxylase family protein [Frankia sp.]